MASRSWNRVELIGNLTRDPELRYTPNGAAVCTFGLATNRTYVTDGEKKEEVDFHRLVSWNKLAELCNQLLKKGTKVFISGRLQTRSWEGQDGQTRNVTEIVVEDMILLSPKQGGDYQPAAAEDVSVAPVEEPAEVEKKEPEKKVEPARNASQPASQAERGGQGASVAGGEVSKAPPEEVKDDDLPF